MTPATRVEVTVDPEHGELLVVVHDIEYAPGRRDIALALHPPEARELLRQLSEALKAHGLADG